MPKLVMPCGILVDGSRLAVCVYSPVAPLAADLPKEAVEEGPEDAEVTEDSVVVLPAGPPPLCADDDLSACLSLVAAGASAFASPSAFGFSSGLSVSAGSAMSAIFADPLGSEPWLGAGAGGKGDVVGCTYAFAFRSAFGSEPFQFWPRQRASGDP